MGPDGAAFGAGMAETGCGAAKVVLDPMFADAIGGGENAAAGAEGASADTKSSKSSIVEDTAGWATGAAATAGAETGSSPKSNRSSSGSFALGGGAGFFAEDEPPAVRRE